jgi:hypothetical protein
MNGNPEPVAHTGYLDFSNGSFGAISFPAGTTFPQITAIAVVKKMVAGIGSSYNSWLSDVKDWHVLTTLMEAIGGTPANSFGYFGSQATGTGASGQNGFTLWYPYGQGWHMMAMRYDGTNMEINSNPAAFGSVVGGGTSVTLNTLIGRASTLDAIKASTLPRYL